MHYGLWVNIRHHVSLQVNVKQGSVDESRRLKGVWLTMDIEYTMFGRVYLVPDSVSTSLTEFKEPVDLTRDSKLPHVPPAVMNSLGQLSDDEARCCIVETADLNPVTVAYPKEHRRDAGSRLHPSRFC